MSDTRHKKGGVESTPEEQTATQISLSAEPVVMEKNSRASGDGVGNQIKAAIDTATYQQGRVPMPKDWNLKTIQAATQKLKKKGYELGVKTVKNGDDVQRYVAFYNNPVLTASEEQAAQGSTEDKAE